MRRVSAALAAAAAAVALLSACGGGDDGDAQEVASLGTDAASEEQPADTAQPTGTEATTESEAIDGSTPTGGSEPTGSAPTDPEEAMLAYTECMRENGIDMPDPEISADGRSTMGIAIEPGQEEELEEAEAACGWLMESATANIEVDPEEQAEMREQMLEYTECMRENGIDMPDPVFDDNGGVTMQREEGEGDEPFDPEDEEFQAAQEACGDDGMIMAAPAEAP